MKSWYPVFIILLSIYLLVHFVDQIFIVVWNVSEPLSKLIP